MAKRWVREHLGGLSMGLMLALLGLYCLPVSWGQAMAAGVIGVVIVLFGVAAMIGATRTSAGAATRLLVVAGALVLLSLGLAFLAWAIGGSDALSRTSPLLVASTGLVVLCGVPLAFRRDHDVIQRLVFLAGGPIGVWILWVAAGSPSP